MYHVSAHDLAFGTRPVPCYSSAGVPYVRWVDVGMPKISQALIKSTFFLFKDSDAAIEGIHPGGTGCIVAIPPDNEPDGTPYYYAVSCLHVVHDTPCVRLNKKGGGTDHFDLAAAQWKSDPAVYGDVAVCMIGGDGEVHDASAIPAQMLLTKEQVTKHEIGVGDDVFMVGLFLDDKRRMNRAHNNPVARFGHISMMPSSRAPFNPDNKLSEPREYFLLDVHSRTGFSGSPVFVYRTPDSDLTKPYGDLPYYYESIIKLLGIHCGQFPGYYNIDRVVKDAEGNSLTIEKSESKERLRGLSGITFIAPAWDVHAILYSDERKEERARLDRQGRRRPGLLLESPVWRTGEGMTLQPNAAQPI